MITIVTNNDETRSESLYLTPILKYYYIMIY